MAYIGQRPVIGRYIKLDQISSGFNGSNTGFSMTAGSQAVFPGTARNLLLSLGGVIQEPDTDFTISGSTLTFTTAPVANTTFFGVIYGDMQATGTPSDGTVLPASIASSGNFSFPEVTVTGSATIGTDLIHAGDTDTKLSFGTNEITLNTAGSERLELDIDETTFNDGGNDTDFRIRTPAQTHMFFVNAGADQIGIKTSSLQSGAVLTINGRTHLETQLTLGSNSTLDAGAQATIYKPATNTLAFATAGANERLRITNTGQVGIGTLSPKSLSGQTHLTINQAATGTQVAGIALRIGDADGGNIISYPSNGEGLRLTTFNADKDITFVKNISGSDSELMRIETSGNVGIGDASPAAGLDVKVDTNPVLAIDRGSANTTNFNLQYNGTLTGQCSAANQDFQISAAGASTPLSFFTNGGVRMTIDENGLVGIGTTNPSGSLHIDADSGIDGPVFESGGTGNTNHAFIVRDSAANQILRINNNGKIGINTTSPGASLDIAGNTDNNIQAIMTRASDPDFQIQFRNESSSNNVGEPQGKLGLFHGSNDIAGFQFNRGGSTGAGSLSFTTGGTERMSLSASSLSFAGTKNGNAYEDATLIFNIKDSNGNSKKAQILSNKSSDIHSTLEFGTTVSNSFDERMRIHTNGFVGIGTSSPQGGLHVQTGTITELNLWSSAGFGRSKFNLRARDTGTSIGLFQLHTESTVPDEPMLMTIKNNGDVCLGTENSDSGGSAIGNNRGFVYLQSGHAIVRSGSTSVSNASGICYTAKFSDTGTGKAFRVMLAQTEIGSIGMGAGGTSFNTSSDYRRKENVVDLTGAIARLKTLLPKRFNFKDEPSVTRDGFLAHEVTAVPEAVTGTKDAVEPEDNENSGVKKGDPIYQQLDQSKLVPLLTAALQEAITKIETLETKVAALEAA